MSSTYPALKYPWQRAVLDVFQEFDPKFLPAKIEIAERAIVERLSDGTSVDELEHTAIADVQSVFGFLFPKHMEHRKAAGDPEAA